MQIPHQKKTLRLHNLNGLTGQKVTKCIAKWLFMFLLSGLTYCLIEIWYRGRTHWTMFLLAGTLGLVFVNGLNNVFSYDMDFLLQGVICFAAATAGEYIVGIIFNRDYSIWDYRSLPLNFQGQICLLFSLLWSLVSMVFIPVLDYADWRFFDYKPDMPPYYKVFGKVIFKLRKRKD